MRQLDLFGFTQEESIPAVKEQVKETPVNAAEKVKIEEPETNGEEPNVAAFVQTSILDAVVAEEATAPAPPPAPQDNIVFSDNNIKVKIKVKAVAKDTAIPSAAPIEAPAPVTAEEPETTVVPEATVEEEEKVIVPENKIEEQETVAPVIPEAEAKETAIVAATAITSEPEEIAAPEVEAGVSVETEQPVVEAPFTVEAKELVEEPQIQESIQETALQVITPEKIEEPVVLPKKTMTTVIKPEENKILAPITPKPAVRKTPPPAAANKKRGRKSFKEIDAEVDLVNVPDDDALFQKQYYPISTVATWFNVNTSLLRYWENEFDILKPRKNRKGDRLFRPEDVKTLQTIYYLLRQRKFTIEGAKEYLKSNKRKVDLNAQLVQSLTRFRSFLLELKANL